jgi:SSS family solute:Na+ symporter
VRALEFLVPTMLLMLGNQVMYQKFFSAKRSERDARISVVGWILGTLLLETLIVAIAVFGSALYPTGEVARQPYEIIPYTARHGLPALMGALLLGAVFAKVISTASNYLFSPATNLVEDVFVRYMAPGRVEQADPDCLAAGRGAAGLLGALPGHLCAEHSGEDALGLHHLLRRAHAGGAGGLLLEARHGLGRGGGHRRRHGGHAGVGCARRQGVVSADSGPARRHLPGAVCAVAAMVVVSLFTRAPRPEQLAQFSD